MVRIRKVEEDARLYTAGRIPDAHRARIGQEAAIEDSVAFGSRIGEIASPCAPIGTTISMKFLVATGKSRIDETICILKAAVGREIV
jgi:hypothetical protein